MGKIKDISSKLKHATPNEVEKKLLEIITEIKAQMIDLNTMQLMQGKDSEDKPIRPVYRNPMYAEFKLHLNPAGVVDLKLTGDFHDSFFMKSDSFPLMFGATDEKTKELTDKYGKNIFGVDKKNLNEISKKTIVPELITYFRGLV